MILAWGKLFNLVRFHEYMCIPWIQKNILVSNDLNLNTVCSTYIPITCPIRKHVRCNPDAAPRLTSGGYEDKVDVITPINMLFIGGAEFWSFMEK